MLLRMVPARELPPRFRIVHRLSWSRTGTATPLADGRVEVAMLGQRVVIDGDARVFYVDPGARAAANDVPAQRELRFGGA